MVLTKRREKGLLLIHLAAGKSLIVLIVLSLRSNTHNTLRSSWQWDRRMSSLIKRRLGNWERRGRKRLLLCRRNKRKKYLDSSCNFCVCPCLGFTYICKKLLLYYDYHYHSILFTFNNLEKEHLRILLKRISLHKLLPSSKVRHRCMNIKSFLPMILSSILFMKVKFIRRRRPFRNTVDTN